MAFAAIESVVSTYDLTASALEVVTKEVEYWRLALPYAFKSGGKEYNKELLHTLSSLINRLSDAESHYYEEYQRDDATIRAETCAVRGARESLPVLTSFVCDFLITELIVHQGAYPGTVADKEAFVLSLFHSLIAFVAQDEVVSMDARASMGGNLSRRRPRLAELSATRFITLSMLSGESISALFSLLHSMWDSTRAAAFTCLCHLVQQAHTRDLPIPARFSSRECFQFIQARGLYLASSPRQREADTGARMLAFVYTLLESEDRKCAYLERYACLLSDRLKIMADMLDALQQASSGEMESPRDNTIFRVDGRDLPMAHGIIESLRLAVESGSIVVAHSNALYERIALMCCRAVQISLSVVADLKENVAMDDEDVLMEECTLRAKNTPAQAPLNVNTGAIGANATFSSVTDESDWIRRFAIQRVIVSDLIPGTRLISISLINIFR